MIDRWLQPLLTRFDALTRRERLLIAAAAIGGVLMVGNTLLIDMPLAKARLLTRQWQSEQNELRSLEQQITTLSTGIRDPDHDSRQQRDRLRQQLQALEAEIQAQGSRLIPPEDMPRLLERLLARHASLRLLSLRTLPPAPLVRPPVAAEGAKEGETPPEARGHLRIWKHGLEIRMQGGYAELQAYVADLESLGQRLSWGPVRLVARYPVSELQIVLYTYSLESTWLKF